MVDIALEVNPLVCMPIERLPNEFVLACERLLVRLELSHCHASSLVAAASLPDLLLQSFSQHLVNVIDTIILFLHLRCCRPLLALTEIGKCARIFLLYNRVTRH